MPPLLCPVTFPRPTPENASGAPLPRAAVWIANPVLSLIDTSIVGLGSTLELAALAPATSVCNNFLHFLGFLGISTTGLVARAMARGDAAGAKEALDQALRVAATTGVVVGAAFLCFATPMIAAFAGPACTELVEPAVAYTRIRAFGFPFALAMSARAHGFETYPAAAAPPLAAPPSAPTPAAVSPGALPPPAAVGQAASLACKDPRPPVLATMVAAALNLVGDVLLCVYPFKLGIAGAAWATVAAQAVRPAPPGQEPPKTQLCAAAAARTAPALTAAPPLPRARLQGATATVLWQLRRPSASGSRPALLDALPLRLPTADVWWRFVTLGGPVAIVIFLKVLYFTLVTRAATAISPISAAAHGVMLSIFVVLGILGDAVSQVAQAFLPGVLGRPAAAVASATRLLQLGGAVGAVNCAAMAVVATSAGSLFTTSGDVLAAMATILPVSCATLVLHNMSMASEGMMLASRELPYLLVTYAIGATLAVTTLSLAVSLGWGLPGVWLAVLQFQVTRLGQNGLRLFFSEKSPLKAVEGEAATAAAGAGGKRPKDGEIELTDVTF